MRHRKSKVTLGRERGPREALFRGLVESLVLHGAIVTTEAKAKALRPIIERLVTKAKRGGVNERRNALRTVYTDKAAKLLFTAIAPRYAERRGGYTRITKIGRRANDNGVKARIEFV